ncbi:hypothetical protein ALC57_05060 [Trachymyrmex cornetzi]|uniref:Uncharacterized protein n=1 Tax=Trachymyrmex cornetzi TaxID=471704 RepID=A0A151JBP4_9HYME|nr:hypothetical protein ALC57_05060 [Trachymyrmex cornetzi]
MPILSSILVIVNGITVSTVVVAAVTSVPTPTVIIVSISIVATAISPLTVATTVTAAIATLSPSTLTKSSTSATSGATTATATGSTTHTDHSIGLGYFTNILLKLRNNIRLFMNIHLLTSLPFIVCFEVFNNSFTTCSDSKVMKQNPFL